MKVVSVLALWLAGSIAAAQSVEISGPVSGFIFDPRAGAIRPIYGLPGAAYLGDALAVGLEWASVSPGGRAALVIKEGRLWGVYGLDRLQPVWHAVEAVAVRAQRAAWSPDGSAAVIYCSTSGLAQVISNLGNAPSAGEPLAVGSEISALAVDSRGRVAVGRADGVYLISPSGPPVLLAATPGARAIVVAEASLWVAGADGWIVEIQDYAAQPKALVLAEVGDPVGVGVSADRRALFVASRSERSVEAYDLLSRTPVARLALDSEPASMEGLAGRNLWLLRGLAAEIEPLLVFKADPEPGVWFVPVGRGE